MHDAALDTMVLIPTPENIAFHFRLAGPFRRFPAFLIDLLVRIGVLIVLTTAILPVFGLQFGSGILLTVYFALDWFYGAVLEGFFNGQTIGKRIGRLRVVSTEGLPITPSQALLRNFLRAADYTPVLLLPAAVSFLFTRRFQRLGDVVAGTMVVVEEKAAVESTRGVDDEAIDRLAETLPSVEAFDRSFSQALAAYCERRPTLSPPRRFEIAGRIAAPLAAQWKLPKNVNPDHLVCAIHKRIQMR